MTAQLVTIAEFRSWAGASNVPDALIQACLDEAESSILADVSTTVAEVQANEAALSIVFNEEMRRAQRFLARRNSPEGLAGAGDLGLMLIPTRDPDSQTAVWRIQAALEKDEGVA